MLKKIDHVGLIVKDANETARLFSEALGFQTVNKPPYEDLQGGFKSIFIVLGEIKIELLTPTSTDNSLARFLNKRGEGLHHISLEVDNLNHELDSLKAKNVRLISEKPEAVENDKVGFIHPSALQGVLVELVEKSKSSP